MDSYVLEQLVLPPKAQIYVATVPEFLQLPFGGMLTIFGAMFLFMFLCSEASRQSSSIWSLLMAFMSAACLSVGGMFLLVSADIMKPSA